MNNSLNSRLLQAIRSARVVAHPCPLSGSTRDFDCLEVAVGFEVRYDLDPVGTVLELHNRDARHVLQRGDSDRQHVELPLVEVLGSRVRRRLVEDIASVLNATDGNQIVSSGIHRRILGSSSKIDIRPVETSDIYVLGHITTIADVCQDFKRLDVVCKQIRVVWHYIRYLVVGVDTNDYVLGRNIRVRDVGRLYGSTDVSDFGDGESAYRSSRLDINLCVNVGLVGHDVVLKCDRELVRLGCKRLCYCEQSLNAVVACRLVNRETETHEPFVDIVNGEQNVAVVRSNQAAIHKRVCAE